MTQTEQAAIPLSFPAMPTDSTQRFTRRVEDYVRYRPSYPPEVFETLRAENVLREGDVVADIGSGTGILSEGFLRAGHRVFGVEPNTEMRAAGERGLLPAYGEQFTSVPATAEATTLPDASVDLVAAGQAFHWFDPVRAREEFVRILRPGGAVALVWNERQRGATPFLVGYDQLLRTHGTDYLAVRDSYPTPERVRAFVGSEDFGSARFPNGQAFDFAGLRGRTFSSSYTPAPDSPGYGPMLEAMRVLFDEHQVNGEVRFAYDTVLYWAGLPRPG